MPGQRETGHESEDLKNKLHLELHVSGLAVVLSTVRKPPRHATYSEGPTAAINTIKLLQLGASQGTSRWGLQVAITQLEIIIVTEASFWNRIWATLYCSISEREFMR